MKTRPQTPPRSTHRFAYWLLPLALTAPALQAEEAKETPDQNSANYVVFSATGVDLNGSESTWRAHSNRTSNLQGGIEALHYETALKQNWFMEMDAHGILDENDYGMEFLFEKPGFNQTRIGFETFRTWSDAHTIYLPDWTFSDPFDPSLALDRSKFTIESTFTPEEGLSYTFRYTLRTREGQKASTSWGGIDNIAGERKIVPSFQDIDEVHHTIELEVDRRMAKTDWGAALRWDRIDYENAFRYVDDPDTAPSYAAQEEDMESDTLSARAMVEHRVSEKLTLNASGMVSRLEGDVSTTRIRNADSFYPTLADFPLYHGAEASFDLDQYVMTFSALYQPVEHWVITPSLRFEKTGQNADAVVDGTKPTESHDDYDSITAELGARYTALTNWNLYADALASHTEGNLDEMGGSSTITRDTDYDRDMAKFTLGANWNAHRKATVAFQVYHKIAKNNYDNDPTVDNSLGNYPAFLENHDQTVDDFNIRLNWRVLPTLTSITRFDYQYATIDTRSIADPTIESGKHERFVYSESLTYQATQRLNLFGSVSYAQDTFSTPASDFYGSQETAYVAEGRMDYITGQLSGVYAYNDTTDITLTTTAVLSDNYYDNSAISVPYSTDFAEYSFTASVAKWLSQNKRVTLGYGYYDYNDDYTGGVTDYSAHVITAKYEYRF